MQESNKRSVTHIHVYSEVLTMKPPRYNSLYVSVAKLPKSNSIFLVFPQKNESVPRCTLRIIKLKSIQNVDIRLGKKERKLRASFGAATHWGCWEIYSANYVYCAYRQKEIIPFCLFPCTWHFSVSLNTQSSPFYQV